MQAPPPVTVRVCFLRGAPGVGKSTIGRLLIERLGAGALVEVDQFRGMLEDAAGTTAVSTNSECEPLSR